MKKILAAICVIPSLAFAGTTSVLDDFRLVDHCSVVFDIRADAGVEFSDVVPADAAAVPSDYSTLVAHYDFDDAASITSDANGISQIDDQTVANHDLVQSVNANKPEVAAGILNGKDCGLFDGDDWLDAADDLGLNVDSEDVTVIMVLMDQDGATRGFRNLLSQLDGTGQGRTWMSRHNDTAAGWAAVSFIGGGTARESSETFIPDTAQIWGWNWDQSTSTVEWFLNGVSAGSEVSSAGEAASGILKFATSNTDANSWNGLLCESAIWEGTKLTPTEHSEMAGTWAASWGVQQLEVTAWASQGQSYATVSTITDDFTGADLSAWSQDTDGMFSLDTVNDEVDFVRTGSNGENWLRYDTELTSADQCAIARVDDITQTENPDYAGLYLRMGNVANDQAYAMEYLTAGGYRLRRFDMAADGLANGCQITGLAGGFALANGDYVAACVRGTGANTVFEKFFWDVSTGDSPNGVTRGTWGQPTQYDTDTDCGSCCVDDTSQKYAGLTMGWENGDTGSFETVTFSNNDPRAIFFPNNGEGENRAPEYLPAWRNGKGVVWFSDEDQASSTAEDDEMVMNGATWSRTPDWTFFLAAFDQGGTGGTFDRFGDEDGVDDGAAMFFVDNASSDNYVNQFVADGHKFVSGVLPKLLQHNVVTATQQEIGTGSRFCVGEDDDLLTCVEWTGQEDPNVNSAIRIGANEGDSNGFNGAWYRAILCEGHVAGDDRTAIVQELNRGWSLFTEGAEGASGGYANDALVHYGFESSGAPFDKESGRCRNCDLTPTATPTRTTTAGEFVIGVAGSDFDSGDLLQCDDADCAATVESITGDMCMGGWFFPELDTGLMNANVGRINTGTSGGYRIQRSHTNDNWQCDFNDGTSTTTWSASNNSSPVNTWSHVLCCHDDVANETYGFVNGKRDSATASSFTGPLAAFSSGDWRINNDGAQYVGKTDDLHVTERLFTELEVCKSAACGLTGEECSCVGPLYADDGVYTERGLVCNLASCGDGFANDLSAAFEAVWDFNEAAGSDRINLPGTLCGTDCDWFENGGTVIQNTTLFVEGGAAAEFRGVDNSDLRCTDATCGDELNEDLRTTGFTVSQWLRMTIDQTDQIWDVSNTVNDGWEFIRSATNDQIWFRVKDAGGSVEKQSSNDAAPVDTWVNVTGRWNESTGDMDLFINGVIDGAAATQDSMGSSNENPKPARAGNEPDHLIDLAWLYPAPMTDESIAWAIACGPDGRACRCDGTAYTDDGYQTDQSMSMTLPDCNLAAIVEE